MAGGHGYGRGGLGPFYGSDYDYDYDDDDYAYGVGDQDCYRTQRYHTRTGWHSRQVYVCG